ncbi:MAG: hypothetical protein PHR87_06555 [Sulfurospirillaceae bacterium]|nr:hypothetical protein [Sulfurospirillaceae bacterium]
MQIVIFLLVVIVISSVFVAKKDELSTRSKIILLAIMMLVVFFAWLYESAVSKESQEDRMMLNAFKQGKTLYCNDVEVTAKKFVFISGTLSFIANDKNKDNKGLVIDIATCKIEK